MARGVYEFANDFAITDAYALIQTHRKYYLDTTWVFLSLSRAHARERERERERESLLYVLHL